MKCLFNVSWKTSLVNVVDNWDKKHVITSEDVDGILSALLFCERFGAKFGGIYAKKHLVLFDDITIDEAKDAIWLDQDISQKGIKCIGQHLVLHSSKDKLPLREKNSFNPNNYFNQSWSNSFSGKNGRQRDKYPFATIHFLIEGLNFEWEYNNELHYALLAHADGAWATSIDYEYNTKIWSELLFSPESIIHELISNYTLDVSNYDNHKQLIEKLSFLGIYGSSSRINPSSKIPEKWIGIQGHQSVTFRINSDNKKWLSKFRNVLQFIMKCTGQVIESPSKIGTVISGSIETPYPASIQLGAFDEFMLDKKIFSHAITGYRILRFTNKLQL